MGSGAAAVTTVISLWRQAAVAPSLLADAVGGLVGQLCKAGKEGPSWSLQGREND